MLCVGAAGGGQLGACQGKSGLPYTANHAPLLPCSFGGSIHEKPLHHDNALVLRIAGANHNWQHAAEREIGHGRLTTQGCGTGTESGQKAKDTF